MLEEIDPVVPHQANTTMVTELAFRWGRAAAHPSNGDCHAGRVC